VVAVADELYRDVLTDGPHGLPGSAFRQVHVQNKEYSTYAWIYLPRIMRLTAEPSDATAPATTPPEPTISQHNEVSGSGTLFTAQGGSVYGDARTVAPAPDQAPSAEKRMEQRTTVRDHGRAFVAQDGIPVNPRIRIMHFKVPQCESAPLDPRSSRSGSRW
jgi:hypothetical protein